MKWVKRKREEYLDPYAEYELGRPAFSIKLHHGGRIEGDKYKSYENGEIDYFDMCHGDYMSLQAINRMVEKCGHRDAMLYYYIDPRSDLTHGLKELVTDEHVIEFCSWVCEYKLMEVFCHHLTTEEVKKLELIIVPPEPPTKCNVVIEEIEDECEVVPTRPAKARRRIKGLAALGWKDETSRNETPNKPVTTMQQLHMETEDEIGDAQQGHSTLQTQESVVEDPLLERQGDGGKRDFTDMNETVQQHEKEPQVDGDMHEGTRNEFQPDQAHVEEPLFEGQVNDEPTATNEHDIPRATRQRKRKKNGPSNSRGQKEKRKSQPSNTTTDATIEGTAASTQVDEDRNPLLDDTLDVQLNSDPDSEATDREDPPVRYTAFNTGRDGMNPQLHVGQKFGTKKEFRDAIRNYAILTGRPVYLYTSDKGRLRAKCRNPGCNWYMYAAKVSALGTDDFVMKTINDVHTNCSHSWRNKNMTSEWVADRFEETIKANMRMPVGQLLQQVDEQYNCEITRHVGYKALSKARNNIKGSAGEQYAMLGRYAAELQKTHPNSTVDIKFSPRTDPQSNPKFMRFYCCLGPFKKGFKEGCRPLIALDGCHTKGPYPGQLLTAIAADPNNGWWPLAWAVVEKEAREQWHWFLSLLIEDVEIPKESSEYTFISDQQKVTVYTCNSCYSNYVIGTDIFLF